MSGMAFQNLRDGLQRVVANSVLSLVFLLPVFGVVFLYDVVLGSVVLIFSVVALSIMIFGECAKYHPASNDECDPSSDWVAV